MWVSGIMVVLVVACLVRIVTWCRTDMVSLFVVEGELRELLVKRELSMVLVPIANVAPMQPSHLFVPWWSPMREPRGVQ